MSFRLCVGNHQTALPVGANGILRPPEAPGVEILPVDGAAGDGPLGPAVTPLADALAAAGWDRCDCYLQWQVEYTRLPSDVFAAGAHLALMAGDWNVAGRMLRLLAPVVPTAACDRPGVAVLRRLGFARVLEALPWGWDPNAWQPHDVRAPRDLDLVFVGSLNPAIHQGRERWLARLGTLAGRHRVHLATAVYGDAYRALHARARLVFNYSVRGEANMRAFEAAVAGACVLNERGNASLPAVFEPGVDYAEYDEDDVEEVVATLLADDERRLRVAAAGQERARPHTYPAHLGALAGALRDALAGERPPPAPAGLEAARLVSEQWRLAANPEGLRFSAVPLRRAGAGEGEALRAAALATPALRGEAPLALAATSAAVAALGSSADLGVLLARAEALHASGSRPEAAAAALAALDAPAPADGRVPTADYGEWRMPLEEAVLAAAGDDAARAAAGEAARRRARFLAAPLVEVTSGPAAAAALLEQPGDDDVVGLLRDRARLRLLAGRVEEAAGDLRAYSDRRPLDVGGWRSFASVLSALGRGEQAAEALQAAASALAGFPAEAEQLAALQRESQALPVQEDAAWYWPLADDVDDVARVVAARARGQLAPAALRIAAPDEQGQERIVAAVLFALEALGVDASALPETGLATETRPALERFLTVARARLVIARPGRIEAVWAEASGRALLDPARLPSPS